MRFEEFCQGLALRSPELWILILNLVIEQRRQEHFHLLAKRRMIPEIWIGLAYRSQRRSKDTLAAFGQNDSPAVAQECGDAAEQREPEQPEVEVPGVQTAG